MMPQGLPTSETLPVSDQSPAFKQSTCHSKENSGTKLVTINANSVMTSIKQGTGTTNTFTTSMHAVPKHVDVLVISHEHESLNISHNVLEQTGSLGKPGYRLSELVTQQNLFHSSSGDTELEPVRPDVLSVRRRNRQFFTLLEEEEKENGEKELTEGVPHSDTEKKLHIQPVFGLGSSMRKLYCPNHNNPQKQQDHADGSHPVSEFHSSASDVSEPEDSGVLYEKVAKMAGMRRIQSHPEFHELADIKNRMTKCGEIFDPFDNYGLSKPKSVPTTPLLGSPKTIRKHMQSVDHTHGDKTPGYSFLASVADELKSLNEKLSMNARHRNHESIHAHQSVEKIKTQNHVAHTSETSAVVAANNTSMTVTQSGSLNPSTSVSTSLMPAHLEPADKHGGTGKSSGFVNFFKSLATNKPMNVSSKESNMFSPQSF